MYRYNMIPTINKPKSVGKNSATAIYHFIVNCIVHCQFKTAILKTDVIYHFRNSTILRKDEPIHQSQKTQNVHKRNYDEKAITSCNHLNNDFEKLTGKSFEKCEDSNEAYKHFIETFISVYDNFFPKIKARIKTKSLRSPWIITKGICKSSKRKQKHLKKITTENEPAYK